MSPLMRSLTELLGRDPKKPQADEISPAAQQKHIEVRKDKTRIEKIRVELAERAAHKPPEKLRRKRWAVLILVNLLFLVSYLLDIQILEGALTASRFVGFHMADLNSALQVVLAFKHVVINLLIGTVTVFIMWCCWEDGHSVPGCVLIICCLSGRKCCMYTWPRKKLLRTIRLIGGFELGFGSSLQYWPW